jgi:hypothetical protein
VYIGDQKTGLMSLCCEDVSKAVWLSTADFAAAASAAMRSVHDITHLVSQSNDVIRFIYGHHPVARRRYVHAAVRRDTILGITIQRGCLLISVLESGGSRLGPPCHIGTNITVRNEDCVEQWSRNRWSK